MSVYQGAVAMITALTFASGRHTRLSFINAASSPGCRSRSWARIRADNVGIGHPCR